MKVTNVGGKQVNILPPYSVTAEEPLCKAAPPVHLQGSFEVTPTHSLLHGQFTFKEI